MGDLEDGMRLRLVPWSIEPIGTLCELDLPATWFSAVEIEGKIAIVADQTHWVAIQMIDPEACTLVASTTFTFDPELTAVPSRLAYDGGKLLLAAWLATEAAPRIYLLDPGDLSTTAGPYHLTTEFTEAAALDAAAIGDRFGVTFGHRTGPQIGTGWSYFVRFDECMRSSE